MAWKYRGGLLLIFASVTMWVTSAEITQAVFADYRHPFVVTYLGISILALYLPIALFKDVLLKLFGCTSTASHADVDGPVTASLTSVKDQEQTLGGNFKTEQLHGPVHDVLDLGGKEAYPMVSLEETFGAGAIKPEKKLTAKQVAVLGCSIAPLWFLTEYLINAALAQTTVGSVTLLSSTSGLFTLFIGAFLGQENVNIVKVISVFISIAGVAMTTLGNTWAADELEWTSKKNSLLGNLLAILSAITYGLFTVLLKMAAGGGDRLDVQKLFGYIGLFTFVGLWWLAWPLTAIGIEPKLEFPRSTKTDGTLFLNSFLGNFLCDYFMALGIVWTSPLVAALGMSLTIPTAMLEDILVHGQQYSVIYVIGSAQVFLGFVLANVSDWIWCKLRPLVCCP